jgi:glycosyltransferase involved in cell wall biosynthesis
MRILQAIETGGPGGAEQLLIALCTGLQSRGHEVEALLLKPGWLQDQLEAAGITCHQLELSGGIDRPFVARFAELCRQRSIDLLHTHEFSMSWYGRRAADSLSLPHVATVHGKNFAKRLQQRIAAGLAFKPTERSALVAVSQDLAGWLGEQFIPKRRQVRVVANGVPLPEEMRIRPRETDAFRIVAVGNLYPVKNHRLAIEIVAQLRLGGIDASLTILGRGAELERLREQAQSLGIGDSIHLAGYCDEIEPFLLDAELFLSTSTSEGLPLSFLEAMGHALPIVASRVGGVPEVITDGLEGRLYESNDADGAAAAIRLLASDEEERQRMAQTALDSAQRDWSLDAMLDRYLNLYDELRA